MTQNSGKFELWDPKTGRQLRTPWGHFGDITNLVFSRNGRRVLMVESSGAARLRDVDTGKEVRRFQGHFGPAGGLAFSPDGPWVLAGSSEVVKLWDTSLGKHQVVWKVEGGTPQEAEDLQQRMAHEFGADIAATDASRVLRLPGFANRKYDAECLVRATKQSDKTYNLRDFKVASGPAKDDRTAEQEPRRSGGNRATLTQSERDWAYAKRALARGDEPEEIVRRIADFRADEKHDPEYYARLTVVKAQSHLSKKSVDSREPQKPTTRSH